MRLFIAVNPPERFRRDLDTRLDSIRPRVRIAWTTPPSWHLTLAFLGDWPEVRLQPTADALAAAVGARPAFALQPDRIGAFPDLRRPRVLFLHLDGGDPLRQLARDVRAAVDGVWPDGPQDRKDFHPHLTLARVKHPLAGSEAACLQALDLGTWEPFSVDSVALMESALGRQGARYACRATLPLGG
ncbi:MAG TPA: RNA 2',3'-cyclic phosphodiesterase [Candidatus Krumholzibacteria bacterium]|nr:RNA 2',3'-cyclic phosphodiesterase [Candidatus Krumholzibacteria bacterium]HPD72727.1 RNA 2',3'-cyclic phosphodiesterase [Candidatus Krumholzibacteria bacterium]HRY40341.1 RNA 2',3'-cyclic phosphodiesterase [Candidatus Krumholzibacteria bacterium]